MCVLSKIGFTAGVTPLMFNHYLKSLRKLGVPSAHGEMGGVPASQCVSLGGLNGRGSRETRLLQGRAIDTDQGGQRRACSRYLPAQ